MCKRDANHKENRQPRGGHEGLIAEIQRRIIQRLPFQASAVHQDGCQGEHHVGGAEYVGVYEVKHADRYTAGQRVEQHEQREHWVAGDVEEAWDRVAHPEEEGEVGGGDDEGGVSGDRVDHPLHLVVPGQVVDEGALFESRHGVSCGGQDEGAGSEIAHWPPVSPLPASMETMESLPAG